MTKVSQLKKELAKLVNRGLLLKYSMLDDNGELPDKIKKALKKGKVKLPPFYLDYERWYSQALRVVSQLLPDRLDDFVTQYKRVSKGKTTDGLDFVTYSIRDYLLGVKVTRGDDVIVDRTAAIPKMHIQVGILESAEDKFESSLFDLKEVLQADIFDSELDAASELNKKGFHRGAGAICGVVLEKHLAHVCDVHGVKTKKKHPTISNWNQLLKKNEIIDKLKWRFIDHLGDLRNLCDHKKDRDPTKEDVSGLIEGVSKVIKTIN